MTRCARRILGVSLSLCLPLSLFLPLSLTCSALAQESDRFPSFAPDHGPPDGYTGQEFALSQDYPTSALPPEILPSDSISFFSKPLEYARAVLKYGVEGNTEVDWVVQNNAVRKWYHAPWMHPGCGGREFVRGMTRERSSRPEELHPNQKDWCDNWAVGFYNRPGGYTLGQVWKDAEKPSPLSATFPHGTVGMKLLFTTATVEQAPFLEGSLEWTANIYPSIGSDPCADGGPPREMRTVRLLQIDIAVRDKRKDSSTGWVFGTFIYDGSAEGATPFDRMQPVGLMWADDPDVTVDMNRGGVFDNKALHDGSLNTALIGPWDPDNPKKVRLVHAGLGGRLNGPVDNPISSCMSCHGRAGAPSQQVVPKGIFTPEEYTADAFNQFFNAPFELDGKTVHFIPHGAGKSTGPDGEYTRLDYSLQLAVGIRNLRRSQQKMATAAEKAAAAVLVGHDISRGDDDADRWQSTQTPTTQGIPKYIYYLVGVLILVVILFIVMRRRG